MFTIESSVQLSTNFMCEHRFCPGFFCPDTYKNINVQQVHNKYEENVRCRRKRPALLRRTVN